MLNFAIHTKSFYLYSPSILNKDSINTTSRVRGPVLFHWTNGLVLLLKDNRKGLLKWKIS